MRNSSGEVLRVLIYFTEWTRGYVKRYRYISYVSDQLSVMPADIGVVHLF
jgi:hypothetical protein